MSLLIFCHINRKEVDATLPYMEEEELANHPEEE
jgi:hypothetical protein